MSFIKKFREKKKRSVLIICDEEKQPKSRAACGHAEKDSLDSICLRSGRRNAALDKCLVNDAQKIQHVCRIVDFSSKAGN